MKLQSLFLVIVGIFLSGCLVTRQAVRESVKSTPLTPEQQVRSGAEVRFQEMDEQMRNMLGRVESVENKVNILDAASNGSQVESLNERKGLQDKLKIYEEAIVKLESQYLLLAQKLEAMQTSAASSSSNRSSKDSGAKGTYDSAEAEFSKQRWKEAIVLFEKYRSQNPTGKFYGEATYKIGSSFHELGMSTEAKAFYTEVVEKFPKSNWAKKAQARMKTLK